MRFSSGDGCLDVQDSAQVWLGYDQLAGRRLITRTGELANDVLSDLPVLSHLRSARTRAGLRTVLRRGLEVHSSCVHEFRVAKASMIPEGKLALVVMHIMEEHAFAQGKCIQPNLFRSIIFSQEDALETSILM